VDNGSMEDGATIEQAVYPVNDDRFEWYISQMGPSHYQFINRRSGKCMALAADTATANVVQKTCSPDGTQLFEFAPTGDGYVVAYTKHGRPLEVAGASTWADARIAQSAASDWAHHRQFKLAPILAGEPHRLTFSHTTDDAACGEYNFWYDIAQPNGGSLRSPADSFVQLIFVGGKETLNGPDVNPFIAQQVSGDLVAIDPTYGLNEGATTTAGSCAAACMKISSTDLTGQCCSCNGLSKTFKRSTFSTTTYLCQ
jgi:hypothetical protein